MSPKKPSLQLPFRRRQRMRGRSTGSLQTERAFSLPAAHQPPELLALRGEVPTGEAITARLPLAGVERPRHARLADLLGSRIVSRVDAGSESIAPAVVSERGDA